MIIQNDYYFTPLTRLAQAPWHESVVSPNLFTKIKIQIPF